MPKITRKNGISLAIFASTLLLTIKGVYAADGQLAVSGSMALPFLFIFVNFFQTFLATIMVLEVKAISRSTVWNRIISGNVALIGAITSIAILLIKMQDMTSRLVQYAIAFFFTFAVTMVIFTIYLLIVPLLK